MSGWNWRTLRAACTIAEDDAVLALHKPVGISVMGERHDTDIVRLAAGAGEQLYPVHRIDKVTSGVVLLAKTLPAHGGLTRQFQQQTVDKRYLVITRTAGLPAQGTIDLPLGAGRKGTVRITAPRDRIRYDDSRWWVAPEDLLAGKKAYPSFTRFITAWSDPEFSLLVAQPVTGRRHQLRVHLAWIGHPILGDPLFDRDAAAAGARTCLHSWRLGFDAPWRRESRWQVEAAAGDDFWQPLSGRLEAGARAGLLDAARTHPFLTVARPAP
jgi:tRNA pseudouridine32 synthase / 23S rRNA pseudouridine746 synthase